MDKLTAKEQLMSQSLLGDFVQNIDTDIREPILRQIKKLSQHRIEMINEQLEEE